MLRAVGATAFCINGGGDVYVAGQPEPGRAWAVGVADPADRTRALAVVPGRDLAVATSGPAERGTHVINPFTGRPATGLISVTVTGPSLTWADAYATAAIAMGESARGWLDRLPGYEAMAVRPDGSAWRTSGFTAQPPCPPSLSAPDPAVMRQYGTAAYGHQQRPPARSARKGSLHVRKAGALRRQVPLADRRRTGRRRNPACCRGDPGWPAHGQ
jgi:hypothetical protein